MALRAQRGHLKPLHNDAELIERHIVPHPIKRGRAYARLRDSGYSVATLLRFLDSVDGDVVETARVYELPEESVLAVLAFYRQNKPYIDAVILLENDDWPEP
jgi:hypothetical protein